jgi:acetoin utilization protein AcuB
MYVREYMKSPVITVTPNTLLDEALRTMEEHSIRHLPVVKNRKLVGLVSRKLLREAIPSSPTPLSIWGMQYHMARMKVSDVMMTNVITISPDNTVEEVTTLGTQRRIGTLPVVDEKGNLVGILTRTDLYQLLTHVLGFGQKGTRLRILDVGDSKYIHHQQIMKVLGNYQVDILSAFSVPLPGNKQEDFIIHVNTEKTEEIINDLRKLGLKVEMRKH